MRFYKIDDGLKNFMLEGLDMLNRAQFRNNK